jgi:RHS repeat-associated protein
VVSSAGTTTLTYDVEGRATSISGPGISQTNVYNGLDTRVSKVENSVSTTFVRDGAYVTDPVIRDTNAVYTPGISEIRGGSTRFYHSGLKNVSDQSNGSQSVTASRVYDAFGNVASSTGTFVGPFGYGGGFGYQEDGTGLKLLGHRLYDSSTGRFLTRDPIKDGRNWYVYCENDPVNLTDPSGLSVRGDNAARRADKGMGEGPMDCEDWIRRWVYPGLWENGRAHELPDRLEDAGFREVPNNGRLQPGDLIVMDRLLDKKGRETLPGHVIVVGDGKVDGKRPPGTEGSLELQDASLGTSPGRRRWKPAGGQYIDGRGRPVSIWRPTDPKKE